MSKEVSYSRPLVRDTDGFVSVPVSHKDLDDLIGRLMQMCEPTGDVEQRRALKSEIKFRSREWLDGLYSSTGYDKFTGTPPEAHVIDFDPQPE